MIAEKLAQHATVIQGIARITKRHCDFCNTTDADIAAGRLIMVLQPSGEYGGRACEYPGVRACDECIRCWAIYLERKRKKKEQQT
jgi:hypothetical protein